MYNGDYLIHYGVQGMRWGVRKQVYRSMNRQARKAQRRKFRQEYYKTTSKFENKYYKTWDKKNNKRIKAVSRSKNQDEINKLYDERESYVDKNVGKDLLKKYGKKQIKQATRADRMAVYGTAALMGAATLALPVSLLLKR